MKPQRTQRNTLSPPEAGATLKEYSIREIAEKMIFEMYSWYSVVDLYKR